MRLLKFWEGRCLVAGCAMMLLGVAGCSSGPRLYPVSGSIVYEDGEPAKELAGGMVSFSSQELKITSKAPIKDDGTFQLTTYRPNDGAPAGHYQIAVIAQQPEPDRRRRTPPAPIPSYYADALSSKLEATVEPKQNTITLKVQRNKGKRAGDDGGP